MIRGVVDGPNEAGLTETKLKSAKFAGEEVDNFHGLWRWNKEAIYAVDNTIRTELRRHSIYNLDDWARFLGILQCQ